MIPAMRMSVILPAVGAPIIVPVKLAATIGITMKRVPLDPELGVGYRLKSE